MKRSVLRQEDLTENLLANIAYQVNRLLEMPELQSKIALESFLDLFFTEAQFFENLLKTDLSIAKIVQLYNVLELENRQLRNLLYLDLFQRKASNQGFGYFLQKECSSLVVDSISGHFLSHHKTAQDCAQLLQFECCGFSDKEIDLLLTKILSENDVNALQCLLLQGHDRCRQLLAKHEFAQSVSLLLEGCESSDKEDLCKIFCNNLYIFDNKLLKNILEKLFFELQDRSRSFVMCLELLFYKYSETKERGFKHFHDHEYMRYITTAKKEKRYQLLIDLLEVENIYTMGHFKKQSQDVHLFKSHFEHLLKSFEWESALQALYTFYEHKKIELFANKNEYTLFFNDMVQSWQRAFAAYRRKNRSETIPLNVNSFSQEFIQAISYWSQQTRLIEVL